MLYVWYGGIAVFSVGWLGLFLSSYFPAVSRYLVHLNPPALIPAAPFFLFGVVALEFGAMYLYFRCPACGKALVDYDPGSWTRRGGVSPAFDITECPKCGVTLR